MARLPCVVNDLYTICFAQLLNCADMNTTF